MSGWNHPFVFIKAGERCWSCDNTKASLDIGLCDPCRDRLVSTETPPDSPRIDAEPSGAPLHSQTWLRDSAGTERMPHPERGDPRICPVDPIADTPRPIGTG